LTDRSKQATAFPDLKRWNDTRSGGLRRFQGKPGRRLDRAAGLVRAFGLVGSRRFFGAWAAGEMVMRVSQDGQFIWRPIQSCFARMGWPHVRQLKVNSFMVGWHAFAPL